MPEPLAPGRAPRRVVLLLALAAAVVALAWPALRPAPAAANAQQISIMMDDDQLLYRGDAVRDRTLQRMKALGVDVVRVTVLWAAAADRARSTRKRRKRFRPENPATYPIWNWDPYDRLLRSARRLGIGVYFNPTGPGPAWAHGRAPSRRDRRTWRPKAREFYKFVAALGKRYSGTYRDENDGRSPLPRVTFWSLWNEPNQGGWLTPQSLPRGRRFIPMSPHIYRNLYFYGRKALQDTGHGNDVILLGETAPLGSDRKGVRSALRPKEFIRELLCLDRRGRRYRGRSALIRGCGSFSKFGPLQARGWAHHPYTKRLPPTRRDSHRDSITMANISELPALLDRLSGTGRIASGLPLILSEFGYETKPPDPYVGVPLATQAEWLNIGDWLAYREPRVFGQTQFLLYDVAPVKRYRRTSRKYWFTYQSGLFAHRGQPKPAASAWALPLVSTGIGRTADGSPTVSFWGQLRFLPNDAKDKVYFQHRPPGGTRWTTIGDPVTVDRPLNFFEATLPAPGKGVWRAVWVGPDAGRYFVSREVKVP